ncbi:hypothetical protein ACFSYH_13595 [Populibacterium corticicola]|jgi:hypothetical protein|uniref:5-formyltetrahydrofolate cyclo-ligase n=1 Tax=Populibacterium corticicola TaxID=1812826 RepID=A0ABW5XIQ3_9MICO
MSIFTSLRPEQQVRRKLAQRKHLRAELLAESTEATRVQWLEIAPPLPRT